MRFNISALALTSGFFWGGAIFIVSTAALIWPGYGRAFLDLAASVYPGYRPGPGLGPLVTGTLYGLADGAIAGALFGWIYNLLARRFAAGAS